MRDRRARAEHLTVRVYLQIKGSELKGSESYHLQTQATKENFDTNKSAKDRACELGKQERTCLLQATRARALTDPEEREPQKIDSERSEHRPSTSGIRLFEAVCEGARGRHTGDLINKAFNPTGTPCERRQSIDSMRPTHAQISEA